jgi:hypothetical protein
MYGSPGVYDQQQEPSFLDYWLGQFPQSYAPGYWLGRLPQPWDLFGGGGQPNAPVYQPGWGDVFQNLLPWNQMPGPPQPGPGYLQDPTQWPPNSIPFGPRF